MKQPSIKDRLLARQEPQDRFVVMHQDWRHLLFLHWEYDVEEIQRTLPPGLYADTFNGKVYIGVTPFSLQNLRFSILPPVPGISDFNEVNVRTYVHDENGTPAVWFYSLDADNPAAVEAANLIKLPYKHAKIINKMNSGSGMINFFVDRKNNVDNHVSTFKYKSLGGSRFAESDTLEFFLVERYILFTYWKEKNKLKKIQVHHPPYPLSDVEVAEWDANLIKLDQLNVGDRAPDHKIYSTGVDVKIYNLQ